MRQQRLHNNGPTEFMCVSSTPWKEHRIDILYACFSQEMDERIWRKLVNLKALIKPSSDQTNKIQQQKRKNAKNETKQFNYYSTGASASDHDPRSRLQYASTKYGSYIEAIHHNSPYRNPDRTHRGIETTQ